MGSQGTAMSMILIPLFLLLLSAWVLWGWVVGECRDIKWLRHWCAPVFVVLIVAFTAGASTVISRALVRREVRADVEELLDNIELRLRTGAGIQVVREIQAVESQRDPEEESYDVLDHLSHLNERLAPSGREIAIAPQTSRQ